MKVIYAITAAIIGLLSITILLGSWYTINQRERGVILRNGAVIGEAEPGLHFKWPLVDNVVGVSLETRTVFYDKMSAYSRDQQDATIRMSVIYRVPSSEASDLYSRFGSVERMVERVIGPKVNEQVKNVFGGYNAVTAIQERARLNGDIAAAVHAGVKSLDVPVTIEAVQIENIDFSDAYETSIEQRMLAEVEVQRLRQNAEREKVQAEIVVTQAKAQADSLKAKADAEAYSTRERSKADAEAITVKGLAEAEAIQARGTALRDSPGLVLLTQAERWDGRLPATMLPGNAVPMLSLGERTQ